MGWREGSVLGQGSDVGGQQGSDKGAGGDEGKGWWSGVVEMLQAEVGT
jgi:hypothetical protein